MLFLPSTVYRSRERLLKQHESRKITRQALYERTLELDPHDHIALFELGVMAEESGDRAAAEEYYWRAIESHPWAYKSHLRLSQLLGKDPDQRALSAGLGELGLRKLLLDHEALHAVASERWDLPLPGLENFEKLSKRDQYEHAAEVFARQQADEPPEVTARLRPHRLVHQVQQSIIGSESTVNAIIAEGPLVTPLLTGLLRGVAQDYLDDDGVAERALALLGEIGDPSVLAEILEFASIDDEVLSGASAWAIDRMIAVDPQGAGAVLRELAPGLDVYGRSVAAVKAMKYPAMDPDGQILTAVTSNLKQFAKVERETLVIAAVQGLLARRGAAGLEQARGILSANASVVSPQIRALCEEELELVAGGHESSYGVREEEELSIYDICAGQVSWEEDNEDDEDDEFGDEFEAPTPEQDWIPEPIHRPYTPGRNDPCWCGSEKKYKKCHLAADEQAQHAEHAPPPAVPDQFDDVRRRIGKFMDQALSRAEFQEALTEFGGGAESQPDAVALGDWIVHDYVSPRLGRTVIDEFLRRHGERLSTRERELVESWSRSPFGLYEVQEVSVGRGLDLKDLLRDHTFFAHDISLSRHLVRWDGLLARVVDGERGHEITGVSTTVPRAQLEAFREWLETDRQVSGLDWAQYFKANLPRILRQPRALSDQWLAGLKLRNTDDEELLISKAFYEVLDEAAVRESLHLQKELSVNESGSQYSWLAKAKGGAPPTVLGTIRIDGGALSIECNSKERLERGKALLARVTKSALRHVRDEFTTQQEMKREISRGGGAPAPKSSRLPAEIEQRLLTEAMERHYGTWPDHTLPALNGKTPREAVRTAAGREQVAALLRDFENGEERKRRDGEPYYDIDRLRAELGLRHC